MRLTVALSDAGIVARLSAISCTIAVAACTTNICSGERIYAGCAAFFEALRNHLTQFFNFFSCNIHL